jgi:hypothetical protein
MLCFAVACIAMYIFKHMLTEVAFHYLKKQAQRKISIGILKNFACFCLCRNIYFTFVIMLSVNFTRH